MPRSLIAKISLFLAFVSSPAFANNLCHAIAADPCSARAVWKENPTFEKISLRAVKDTLTEDAKNDVLSFLEKRLAPGKVRPELTAILHGLSPADAAACVANKIISFTFEKPGFNPLPCPTRVQEPVDKYFGEPNEISRADYPIVGELIPVLRKHVSGALEKRAQMYVEEIKAELVTLLKARKAPEKVLARVRAVKYTEAPCMRFKGRDKISFESGSEVYVCQGFAWDWHSIFLWIWTLSHEVGHSLDACELSRYEVIKFPTNTKSMDVMLKKHPAKDLYLQALNEIVDANDFTSGKEWCDHTNLHEAFADVIASMIAPKIIEKAIRDAGVTFTPVVAQGGYLSVGTRMCRAKERPEDPDATGYGRHPRPDSRLRFLFARPEVQRQLGCPAR